MISTAYTFNSKMKKLCLLFIATILFPHLSNAQQPKELGKLYGQGNYEKVISLGIKLLENDTNDPYLNMLVGRSYVELEQFQKAIPFLKFGTEGEAAAYIQAWSNAYLGPAYYMVGQTIQAKAALKTTIYAKATKNASMYATKTKHIVLLGLYSYFNDWTMDSTEQIIFHFQDESLLDKSNFMERRQAALTSILKVFPVKLPKKIDFYVWESVEEAAEKFNFTLGFSRPEYLITHSRKNQSSGHELAHIISHHAVPSKVKSRFINEGLAVFMDQNNYNRLTAAQAAVREYQKKVSIEALWKDGQKYPETLLYPVAGSFTEYCYQNMPLEQFEKLVTYQSWSEVYTQLGNLLMEQITTFETLLK